MGIYLNPGNRYFKRILKSEYVDKSGLIAYVNSVIDTRANLICFSRPRRFGKTMDAVMLSAYYDRSCDSREIFSKLDIGKDPSFEQYLNKLNVISLDITHFISITEDISNIVSDIECAVISELRLAYPNCIDKKENKLANAILSVYQRFDHEFFVIIDEWDALFREAKEDRKLQENYLLFLRSLFKSGQVMKEAIAGAYMTGILPIRKYGTQSALTDFKEFTMTAPRRLARFVGFTEAEVQRLCQIHGIDFGSMQKWYDGYSFYNMKHIYSPNSVMQCVEDGEYANYWTSTETYESLKSYIVMNYDGLKDAVIAMLGGESVYVDTLSFQNDFSSMQSRDDVLTLLVHLGYLAYDSKNKKVYIPNLEVSDSFRTAVQNTHWQHVSQALQDAEYLLEATIRGDEEEVARCLETAHEASSSIIKYNDENALSAAIHIAYYTARNYYEIVREMPAGRGFADFAFIPYADTDKPAMIVELKYNQSADSALRQIKEKRYDGRFRNYRGNILLVGINYDSQSIEKKHTCRIETLYH